MSRNKKFKFFSKHKRNIIDHPKIKFNKLKSSKWVKMKSHAPRKLTNYGNLLAAKQIFKFFYGDMKEGQFINFYIKAKNIKGNTGINFLKLLESRLDIVLFRLRFSNNFNEVRQLISHKHILVNGIIVKSPSFTLKPGDVIQVRDHSFNKVYDKVKESIKKYTQNIKQLQFGIEELIDNNCLIFYPNYLEMNYNILRGSYLYSPKLSEIVYPIPIDIKSSIEYYKYVRKV
jgi:small subunit ribosomal protein S4